MSQPKTNRIPAPLYAAAGAGDLAYQQLRKLPDVVTELSGKAVVGGFELRQKATETLRTANATATRLREKADSREFDLEKLRSAAVRNAAAVVAGAHAAQVRALAVYEELVARGERVVGAGVVQAADTVNEDIDATAAVRSAEPVEAIGAAEQVPVTAAIPADETVTAATPADETVTGTTPAAETEQTATGAAGTEVTATPATVAEVVAAKPKAARTPRARTSKATGTTTPSAKLPESTADRPSRPAAE